jgi:hypothetical protein
MQIEKKRINLKSYNRLLFKRERKRFHLGELEN